MSQYIEVRPSWVVLVVKHPPANVGDGRGVGSIPGLGRFPGVGHGNPFYYSDLENPMGKGICWSIVHRVAKTNTTEATSHVCMQAFIQRWACFRLQKLLLSSFQLFFSFVSLHFHFSLSCIGEGNGNPLQCSCLENPRDGGASWADVYGVAQSRTQLKRLSSSSSSNYIFLKEVSVVIN